MSHTKRVTILFLTVSLLIILTVASLTGCKTNNNTSEPTPTKPLPAAATVTPTAAPATSTPTTAPTATPTVAPTAKEAPTVAPTAVPTVSTAPTAEPTEEPSPTENPGPTDAPVTGPVTPMVIEPIEGFDPQAYLNEDMEILMDHYNEYLEELRVECREGIRYKGGLLATITVDEETTVEIYESAVYGHPLIVSPMDDAAGGFVYRGTDPTIECYDYSVFCRKLVDNRHDSYSTLLSYSFTSGAKKGMPEYVITNTPYWLVDPDAPEAYLYSSLVKSGTGVNCIIKANIRMVVSPDDAALFAHTTDYSFGGGGVTYDQAAFFETGSSDAVLTSYHALENVLSGYVLGRGLFGGDGTVYVKEAGAGVNGTKTVTEEDFHVDLTDAPSGEKTVQADDEVLTIRWSEKELVSGSGLKLFFVSYEDKLYGFETHDFYGEYLLFGDSLVSCYFASFD